MKFISRAQAGLRAARGSTPLNPSFGSTVHWNGPPIGLAMLLNNHDACYSVWRSTQRFHMDSRGWVDIAYTCGVCPHGYVFEGRGIGNRTAANGTNAGNNSAYAIFTFLGQGESSTPAQRRGIVDARNWLRSSGGAGQGFNSHRDWKQTECPGNELAAWVSFGALIEEEDDLAEYGKEIRDNQWRDAIATAAWRDAEEERGWITHRGIVWQMRETFKAEGKEDAEADEAIKRILGKSKLPPRDPTNQDTPTFNRHTNAAVALANEQEGVDGDRLLGEIQQFLEEAPA